MKRGMSGMMAEQETLDAFKADRHLSEGVTVSGTVTSFGDIEADVTINLIKVGETSAVRTQVKKGNNTEYSLDGVAAGNYTLQILKTRCSVSSVRKQLRVQAVPSRVFVVRRLQLPSGRICCSAWFVA